MEPRTIGLIGMGLLGSALRERFLLSGFDVIGWDTNPERRTGTVAGSARGVAQKVDRIVLSLPSTEAVESVLAEIGPDLRSGMILVDTTTGDPDHTAALGARLATRGIHYLDTTVLGSSEETRRADVIVMAGGEWETFSACSDLFACFARETFHLGPWGAGSRMKLVVNLVLGLNRAVLAEGLRFAQACGVDAGEALKVLRAGAAYSRVMDTKGRKMLTGDFAPQARLAQHLKDVRLILEQAARAGAKTPLSALHRQMLEQLVEQGHGDEDNSAIIRAFV